MSRGNATVIAYDSEGGESQKVITCKKTACTWADRITPYTPGAFITGGIIIGPDISILEVDPPLPRPAP